MHGFAGNHSGTVRLCSPGPGEVPAEVSLTLVQSGQQQTYSACAVRFLCQLLRLTLGGLYQHTPALSEGDKHRSGQSQPLGPTLVNLDVD